MQHCTRAKPVGLGLGRQCVREGAEAERLGEQNESLYLWRLLRINAEDFSTCHFFLQDPVCHWYYTTLVGRPRM